MYLVKLESLTFFLYRIPSNPSVGSKGSYKISTDSIGRNSDRSSPLPSYHVEVLELFVFVIPLPESPYSSGIHPSHFLGQNL